MSKPQEQVHQIFPVLVKSRQSLESVVETKGIHLLSVTEGLHSRRRVNYWTYRFPGLDPVEYTP